jgi:hypothetical protein
MSTRKIEALPQRKSRQVSRLVRTNPSKGVNSLSSPALIDDREFSEAQNIEYDETGVARKRSGYDQVLSSLTAGKGLGMFVSESYRHICTLDNGVFKYATTGSFTSVATVGFSTTAIPDFSQVQDKLFIWDGVSGGATWDGATLARPGTIPRASFAIVYQDHQMAAGVTGKPSRLYISEDVSVTDGSSKFTRAAGILNNSTEVPGATVFSGTTANFIDIRPNDGDRITALGRYQDILVIFKERSIYQLTFDSSSNPIVALITGSTGCVSHSSVENVENDLHFLSREGVRRFGNEENYFTALRTNVLSARIQPTIDTITPQYYSKANAHYFDNKYLLSVPTSGSSILTTLVYDTRFQSWAIWTNFNANAYVQYTDTDNKSYLYFMDDAGQKVYKVTPGTYSDDGVAIDAYLVSKAFDMDNPDILKFFLDVGLVFRRLSGQVDVSIYLDGGTSLGTATITQGGANGMGLLPLGMETLGLGTGDDTEVSTFSDEPLRVVVNSNSKVIKFKIQNNRVNENFVFLGFIIAFYPYSHFNFDSQNKIYI